jgi:hypothetical protein
LQFAYNVCGWQVLKHNCVETKQIVEKACKVPIENIFDDFEVPMAFGSIAQVCFLKNFPHWCFFSMNYWGL